jgi:hypothetical protein
VVEDGVAGGVGGCIRGARLLWSGCREILPDISCFLMTLRVSWAPTKGTKANKSCGMCAVALVP